VLREAQQQRIARPGPHQQAYANLAADENYIMSPHATPRTAQGFDGQCYDGLTEPQGVNVAFDLYNASMNVMVKKNAENYSDNMTASQDFELFPTSASLSAMSTPTFANFNDGSNGGPGWISEDDTSSSRRNSRRISNGIMDRVAKFENIGMEGPQRPRTPPQENVTGKFLFSDDKTAD
jgi:regulatory protein SWI5